MKMFTNVTQSAILPCYCWLSLFSVFSHGVVFCFLNKNNGLICIDFLNRARLILLRMSSSPSQNCYYFILLGFTRSLASSLIFISLTMSCPSYLEWTSCWINGQSNLWILQKECVDWIADSFHSRNPHLPLSCHCVGLSYVCFACTDERLPRCWIYCQLMHQWFWWRNSLNKKSWGKDWNKIGGPLLF